MSARQERRLGPEALAMLPKATERVRLLYAGELTGRQVLRNSELPDIAAQRDAAWEEGAQKFPPFSDTIRAFRTSLNNNQAIIKREHPGLILALGTYFGGIEDPLAKELLRDTLITRIAHGSDVLDRTVNLERQVDAMGREIGLQEGFKGEGAKKLTAAKVVESILTEKLKLTPEETNPETTGSEQDTGIRCLGELTLSEREGAIWLYSDRLVDGLNRTFTTSPMGGSKYYDAGAAMYSEPLVVLGINLEEYVGVDERDMDRLAQWANRGGMLCEIRRHQRDVRIAKHGDKEIFFPTTQLLENFRIRKKPSQN